MAGQFQFTLLNLGAKPGLIACAVSAACFLPSLSSALSDRVMSGLLSSISSASSLGRAFQNQLTANHVGFNHPFLAV
jgi:hypothetical protein